ncbi:uncharacterized protein LOC123523334 [Mercenaria mercenaria]|uniref:uncharacterized protein LOC123523334 n=1 Tax=Mercenaria mercenaria TaxID=6596 RepID=UPI00234EAB47|nr:uncharacterized protein LOC123523334 [Mercenaria mercenaria]XP_045156956.2 uncharacterized protein LOC123523334 [Mercenaria mercenaria]
MDSRSIFIEENLNGYDLPAENLLDIREVLMKRFGAKFSDGLSPEGRLAMEQASCSEVDTASAKRLNGIKESPGSAKGDSNRKINKKEKKTKNITFTETYDKRSSERLAEEITDENCKEIGLETQDDAGKDYNALDAIENVTDGEVETNTVGIDNTNLQSVEKCLLWMKVNNKTADTSVYDSEQSRHRLIAENDTVKM